MATSGTFAFNLDLADLFEEAYERIEDELRSGYDYRTARRSLDLMLLEWQNRGLNLWTIESASQALTSGTASYALSGEVLDVVDAVLRVNAGQTSQQDTHMERFSLNDYARQSNKNTQGRPINYWIDHKDTGITMTVWPVPDSVQTYTVTYWYMKRIEDSGKPASNNVDVPARYLPVLVSGLAYYLAMKKPGKRNLLPDLKAEYEAQWNNAADASRDKADFFLKPLVS